MRTGVRARRVQPSAPDSYAAFAPAPPVGRPVRAPRERGLGPRGFTGPAQGATSFVDAPPEWRGTSVQVCGLWPFAAGSGSPVVGVPLGQHLETGATVCGDPISYFRDAGLISNPSMFLLARPGLGKSTLIQRMCIGLTAQGVTPLILGDTRPDYTPVVEALGGEVHRIGRGVGGLNVVDPGGLSAVIPRLTGEARGRLEADRKGRQETVIGALLELVLHRPLDAPEATALSTALDLLNAATVRGTLPEVAAVITAAPDRIRSAVLADTDAEYRALTVGVLRAFGTVLSGTFGALFTGTADTRLDLGASALSPDVSAIPDTDSRLLGAALLACWTTGFAAIAGAQALADAGLGPQRYYFAVLDELWLALRAGQGMADRIDTITRLNRKFGLGWAMVTHSAADLQSLPREEDRRKAAGFIERAGMVVMGGLSDRELGALSDITPLSGAERARIADWGSAGTLNPVTGAEDDPPGRGHFLVKVGGHPGVPLRVRLTAAEAGLRNSNALWHPTPPNLRDAGTVDTGTSDGAGDGGGAAGAESGKGGDRW